MTREQLIKIISKNTGTPVHKTREILDNMTYLICDSLSKNENVKIKGLGSFEVYDRKAINRINPITKELNYYPERKGMRFVPSKDMKESLDAGFCCAPGR